MLCSQTSTAKLCVAKEKYKSGKQRADKVYVTTNKEDLFFRPAFFALGGIRAIWQAMRGNQRLNGSANWENTNWKLPINKHSYLTMRKRNVEREELGIWVPRRSSQSRQL